MMKPMMAMTRAVTSLLEKCSATAIMIRPDPRAPALVVACMRMGRSGMRNRPIAASNMNRAPTSMDRAISRSIIGTQASFFQIAGEADGGEKRGERQHHRHIEKTETLGR